MEKLRDLRIDLNHNKEPKKALELNNIMNEQKCMNGKHKK